MAVRTLNPLEQHAGKIFLGVVLVVCLALVWFFVLSDPVKVPINSTDVSVSDARKHLENDTGALKNKIKPDAPLANPNDLPVNVLRIEQGTPVFEYEENVARRIVQEGGVERIKERTLDLDTKSDVLAKPIEPSIGVPVPAQQVASTITTQPNIVYHPDKLPAPPAPQVASEQRVITVGGTAHEFRIVTARSALPDAAGDFVKDLADQAQLNKWSWPAGKTLLVYAVQLQRQEVDDRGQPVGPVEDVPPFGSPPKDAPNPPRWAKDYPMPGPGDLYTAWGKWLKSIYGPTEAAEPPCYEAWLLAQQDGVRRPKMPDGTEPKLGGGHMPKPAGGGPPPLPAPAAPGEVGPAPAPAAIPAAADPEIWAIDDTVAPAKTYVYRIRYVVFNPAVGQTMLEFGQRYNFTVASPWSEWSEKVQTEQDLFFFLVEASDGPPPVIQVGVFRQTPNFLFYHKFDVRIGEPLGRLASDRQGKKAGAPKVDVDYGTRMIPVDIRKGEVLLRSAEPGASPTFSLAVVLSTQVILRTESGQLILRSLRLDVNDPKYLELKKRFDAQP